MFSLAEVLCIEEKQVEDRCSFVERRMDEVPATRAFAWKETENGKTQYRIYIPRDYRDKLDLREVFPCFKQKCPVGVVGKVSSHLVIVTEHNWETKIRKGLEDFLMTVVAKGSEVAVAI